MEDVKLTFWVIAPEVNTDEVVTAIRRSWLSGTAERSRFCVASGISRSADASLHWLHGLKEFPIVAASRSELNQRLKLSRDKGDSGILQREPLHARINHSRDLTQQYNNFLRHKVFEILEQICRGAERREFDYAFMMDADTAVNVSNLQRFVNSLGAGAAVYSGLCRRRSWGKASGQRGVPGGPGIIFSSPLLRQVLVARSCALTGLALLSRD